MLNVCVCVYVCERGRARVDPYDHMDLCNESCFSVEPASRPTDWPSCMAKALSLDSTCKLFNPFFSHLSCL